MFETWPFWALALVVFGLRVVDVTLGTIRTIAVVNGRIGLSVGLGFLELCIWLTAAAPVIVHVREHPLLILAFAGGFAAGNAVGILIERRMALGDRVVRIISLSQGEAIAAAVRDLGVPVTTFDGQGRDGPRMLLYVSCPRKRLRAVLDAARQLDPDLFYVVESVAETSGARQYGATGSWRSVGKSK